ncbi:MAG: chromate resistance protein [Candidatus Rokubacteria bacterium]|nr:chromate resistance protein [Candidatus Rokubacteria bacterium]
MQPVIHPQAWLVLVVSLPREPSSLRVRAWRRLRALGAVALKHGVYVLPATAETSEQFQWLAQEVQRDGGDAILLVVERIENLADEEIVRRFHEPRNAEYRALADRYRRLLRAIERAARGRGPARAAEEGLRLGRELARLRTIDYFQAPAADEALRAKEAVEMRLAPPAPPVPVPRLDRLRGRLWVTRPRPHVDRMASAWFIQRFVDPEARFVFAAAEARPPAAVPFDVPGAELGHHGDRCTFETLLQASGLRDRRLHAIAEIVHEADLRDGKYARDEARGIDVAARSLLAALPDDARALEAGITLFEGLYQEQGGAA